MLPQAERKAEEMLKRAAFARELGVPFIMPMGDSLQINTSLAFYCRDNGLLLHIQRAMHAVQPILVLTRLDCHSACKSARMHVCQKLPKVSFACLCCGSIPYRPFHC